jgi:hypothetical protein
MSFSKQSKTAGEILPLLLLLRNIKKIGVNVKADEVWLE